DPQRVAEEELVQAEAEVAVQPIAAPPDAWNLRVVRLARARRAQGGPLRPGPRIEHVPDRRLEREQHEHVGEPDRPDRETEADEHARASPEQPEQRQDGSRDRKSTRLNSSHRTNSY